MQQTRAYKIVLAVLAAFVAVGLAAYVYQLIGGLGVTGMSNGTSWGLYIACFMFFGGMSAGSLIVASAASVFKIGPYRTVAVPAVLLSLVCICVAGAFVLVDLGGIVRVLNLLVSPNLASPLLWDIVVITLVLVIDVVYLYFLTSRRAGASRVDVIARIALPAAVVVLSVEAWIFGLQIAREGWYSTIMAPLFVASALDSGLALLLVALVWMNRSEVFAVSRRLVASLAALLAVFVAVDGYLVGCEVLTMAYPGTEQGSAVFGEMVAGATAPFFWIEVIAGVLVPFCILVFTGNRRRTGLVVLACAGVLAGVFCKRLWLLLTSFIYPNVSGAPGLVSGSSSTQGLGGMDGWAVSSSYVPALPELLVAIGLAALGVLAFLVLAQRFLRYDSDEAAAVEAVGCEARFDGAAFDAVPAAGAPAAAPSEAGCGARPPKGARDGR